MAYWLPLVHVSHPVCNPQVRNTLSKVSREKSWTCYHPCHNCHRLNRAGFYLDSCTVLCHSHSSTTETTYRGKHRGKVWSLELHFGHWSLDLSPEVPPWAPFTPIACVPALLYCSLTPPLCLYGWLKAFPLCYLLMAFPIFLPRKTLPIQPCSLRKQYCVKIWDVALMILLNRSFTWFRSWISSHRSTWLMPSSYSFA